MNTTAADVSSQPSTSQPPHLRTAVQSPARSGLTGDASPSSVPAGPRLFLNSAARLCPHPDKVGYGGEDAFFISSLGGGSLGVADGVGGWKKRGVNPANYSRLLMHNSCCHLERRWGSFLQTPITKWGSSSIPVLDCIQQRQLCQPMAAMMAAHTATQVPGSATACIMQLDPDLGVLTAANLGDSGFVVLRRGEVIAHSTALQHHFDCPLQLGHPGFGTMTDWADSADVYEVQVQPGDVVITGTDGLWDNVFLQELLPLAPSAASEVQASADAMASLAADHARDSTFKSPYSVDASLKAARQRTWWSKALKYCGLSAGARQQRPTATGGKLDDVTVLVSYVDSQAACSSSSSGSGAGQKVQQLQLLMEGINMGDLKDSFTAGHRQLPDGDEGPSAVGEEHWKIAISHETEELLGNHDPDHYLQDDLLPRTGRGA